MFEDYPSSFGTILVDPPWDYVQTSKDTRLKGYSDSHYPPLTTADLCELPVGELARDDSVLLLWTVMPFVVSGEATKVVKAWGFEPITAVPWVKSTSTGTTVNYGVGYWFRGAVEMLFVARRKKSYRGQYIGLLDGNEQSLVPDDKEILLSPVLNHSRKPASVYDLAETYPRHRLEIFARNQQPGWFVLGNEAPGDGQPIQDSLPALIAAARAEGADEVIAAPLLPTV